MANFNTSYYAKLKIYIEDDNLKNFYKSKIDKHNENDKTCNQYFLVIIKRLFFKSKIDLFYHTCLVHSVFLSNEYILFLKLEYYYFILI